MSSQKIFMWLAMIATLTTGFGFAASFSEANVVPSLEPLAIIAAGFAIASALLKKD